MTVSVVVPWRPTPDRQPLWDLLRPGWETIGEVVEGSCPDPWRKGAAVADAVSRATSDVLVIADADVWCAEIGRAVEAVAASAPWAVPHARILRLSPIATAAALAGGDWSTTSLERPPHRAVSGGGLVVMRREVFDACPMPVMGRREDEVWQTQLVPRFGRPWRGTADLFHLYHEPAEVSHG